MAADDDRGQTPDPWDEIVADGLDGGTGEASFNFDEVADGAAPAPVAEPGPIDETPASTTPLGDAATDDEFVAQWLSDSGSDAAASGDGPSDDAAGGSSAIAIGTGTSGVALHGEPGQEEIGGATDDGDGGPAAGFPVVSTGGTETEGRPSGAAARRPAKPTKPAKKSGGIGQLVGVALGGMMAIPITLAILIYGLGKDPFGVTKQVPEQVAFLLPEKFRPGYKKPAAPKPGADAAGPSALDALPTVPEIAPEPEPAEPADVASVDEPVMPDDAAPEPEPDLAAVAAGLDDLGAKPEPAGPPPLDTGSLDDAVTEAAALCAAIGAADDTGSGAYKTLRKRWYRSLARVADELVALENVAATSGRPMAATPDNVIALHGTIGDRDTLRTELAALAPFWLAAASRDTDGVVVPVTFESARKVGPYWSTRASIAGASGTPRDLTVISRTEPAAVVGDVVVVTGVAIDREGTVIWAADVRPAAAGGLSAGF